MIKFNATDEWYKKAAELEEGCDFECGVRSELEEMEEYNRLQNEKLISRPLTNLKRCEGIKRPEKIKFYLKWTKKYEYKFGYWIKRIVNQDIPCGFPSNLNNCQICKGKEYVNSTT